MPNLDVQLLREQIAEIEKKRECLVALLEQPSLGTLRLDINQALDELDDLLEEFHRTFPEIKN
jgi:hypothetical protein